MFGRSKKSKGSKAPQFNEAQMNSQINNFGLTEADLKDKDLLVRNLFFIYSI